MRGRVVTGVPASNAKQLRHVYAEHQESGCGVSKAKRCNDAMWVGDVTYLRVIDVTGATSPS